MDSFSEYWKGSTPEASVEMDREELGRIRLAGFGDEMTAFCMRAGTALAGLERTVTTSLSDGGGEGLCCVGTGAGAGAGAET